MTRKRWLIRAIWLTAYLVVVAALLTAAVYVIPDPVGGWLTALKAIFLLDWGATIASWWVYCGVPALLLAGSQALFFAPAFRPPGERGRGPLLVGSIAAAGFVGAVLTTAVVYALLELQRELVGWLTLEVTRPFGRLEIVLGVSWALWSLIFYASGDERTTGESLKRSLSLLWRAALITWVIVVPSDVVAREERFGGMFASCSLHALWLSSWAFMWLPGTTIFLMWLRRRRGLE